MLIEKTIQETLEEISSSSPAPGGGSVSALGGALSASLISKVSKLSIGKKKYLHVEDEMRECLAESENLLKSMTLSIDEDTLAFNELMAVYRVNSTSIESENLRDGAIQEALNCAISVPLKVAKGCMALLKLANVVADKGNANAITDTGVAALMAYAGLKGAILNVRINLQSIKDIDLKKKLFESVKQLMKNGEDCLNKVLASVETKLISQEPNFKLSIEA